ncbi:glycosyltransferase [Vibrio alginolyticus]|uniref:glycosyltransferase family 2 protein n=1 Tax=Vibrio alginolyticus TaxID=663 RepID=UPI0030445AFE
MSKLVSVYITTYNRIGLLKRAVDSVRSQTYQNIEIIIVDDCSTDGTRDYLTSLCQEDKRVKFIFNDINSGACVSRNKAIEASSGFYITGLDDDDYFERNRVEEFVDFWPNREKEVIFLFSNFTTLEVNGRLVKRKKSKRIVSKEDQYSGNKVGTQIFTEKRYLLESGGFDERLPIWQDFECWTRLLSNGDAQRVPAYTYVMDIAHDYGRITKSKKDKIEFAFNIFLEKNKLSQRQHDQLSFFKDRYLTIGVKSYIMKAIANKDLFLFYQALSYLLKSWIKKIIGR